MSRLIAASPVAAATADAACASPLRRSARPAGASGEPLREADRCRFEAAFGYRY